MWSAYVAFAEDPHYFTLMVEAANAIDYKRETHARKRAERVAGKEADTERHD